MSVRKSGKKLAYMAQERWLNLFGHSLAQDFDLDAFSLLVKTKCFFYSSIKPGRKHGRATGAHRKPPSCCLIISTGAP
jgi:hypothetical protein